MSCYTLNYILTEGRKIEGQPSVYFGVCKNVTFSWSPLKGKRIKDLFHPTRDPDRTVIRSVTTVTRRNDKVCLGGLPCLRNVLTLFSTVKFSD